MFRPLFIVLVFFAVVGLVVPELPVVGSLLSVGQVQAQQKKRESLFDRIFKRRTKKRKKLRTFNIRPFKSITKNKRKKLFRTTKKKGKKKRSAGPVVPQVIVVKKSEDAGNILVVGDFIGGGLASELERLYAGNPNFIVVNKTRANSGIVRTDVVDWAARTAELMEEFKPVAVISLVGMNDRQQMRLASGRVQKLSDPWKSAYNQRVENIVKAGSAGNLPFVWIGLPPVRSGAMNSDYLAFNETFRQKTEADGGTFVDVWDGFTNAEGKFVSAGPDIKGRIVRLRGSKGINMTRAGKAKLAFYADKALRRLGVIEDLNQFFSSLGLPDGGTQLAKPEYDPAATGETVVISLGGPASDGGNVLDGAKGFIKSKTGKKSVSYQLVEKGIGYAPREGRVDAAWGNPADNAKDLQKAKTPSNDKTSSLTITPTANFSLTTAN